MNNHDSPLNAPNHKSKTSVIDGAGRANDEAPVPDVSCADFGTANPPHADDAPRGGAKPLRALGAGAWRLAKSAAQAGWSLYVRTPLRLVLVLAVLALLVFPAIDLALRNRKEWFAPQPQVITSQPVLQAVKELAEITASPFRFARLIKFDSDHVEIDWVIYGHAELGIDAAQIQLLEYDPSEKRLRVELPYPRVLRAVVDEQKSGPSFVSERWFADDERVAAALAEAPQAAQTIIALAAAEHLESAKEPIEAMLDLLATGAGWRIVVAWRLPEGISGPVCQP